MRAIWWIDGGDNEMRQNANNFAVPPETDWQYAVAVFLRNDTGYILCAVREYLRSFQTFRFLLIAYNFASQFDRMCQHRIGIVSFT